MRLRRTPLAFVATAITIPLLAGCNPGSDPAATTPPTGAQTPSAAPTDAAPSPTPTAAPDAAPVFTQPTTCSQIVGTDLAATFASRNIELFNSSNGEGIFSGTPVDTHQQGGNPFGCLWGVQNADLNTFVMSVQSLSRAAHEGVVSILDGGGYTKTVNGDVVTYTALGSENGTPDDQLTIHVLRPDSWMTGWAALGGETARTRISGYLDVVASNLYK